MMTRPVERLLDGQDIGILRRGRYKTEKGAKSVIGIMNQNIFFFQKSPDIPGLRHFRNRLRDPFRTLDRLETGLKSQLRNTLEIGPSFALEYLAIFNAHALF
ncbi:MAG: hypothetical protein BWY42_01422 [Candidatus Omnitrophica bacterium ADurb.Bin277]|nr:MAG: hypothetical protein BWY42_01422 [Candidatus Omnitrophica bacterium ADurb.Bin277]